MRFGTTSYFLGIIKLVDEFKIYYTRERKNRVLFCGAVLSSARPRRRKRKPLPRVMVYFFGSLASQTDSYYKKGDYVLVQGRLKILKRSSQKTQSQISSIPTKEYCLNVIKMTLIHR